MMVSVLNTFLQFKIKASVIEMTNLLFIVRNCINDILLRARYTRYTSVRCIMTKNIVNRILVSWWSFLSSLLLFIFHSISFNVLYRFEIVLWVPKIWKSFKHYPYMLDKIPNHVELFYFHLTYVKIWYSLSYH